MIALDFSRYFSGLEAVLSIIFLASKSSLTVSPYQLIFPENLLFKLVLMRLNNSVWVRSSFRRADTIAFLRVSYFLLSIFFPFLPGGCLVSILLEVICLLLRDTYYFGQLGKMGC